LVKGDTLRVELQSIPRDYYYFLNEMTTQINNVGLFATSPANVRTNVRNTQAGSSKTAVGYFAGYTCAHRFGRGKMNRPLTPARVFFLAERRSWRAGEIRGRAPTPVTYKH
jgi:hypothetical protein